MKTWLDNNARNIVSAVRSEREASPLSLCVPTSIALYEAMLEAGFEVSLNAGLHAISFNTHQHGMLTYGVDSYLKLEGSFSGHVWVESGDYIIDLNLLDLEEKIKQNNLHFGIEGCDEVVVSSDPLVHKESLCSYEELLLGKIGLHYEPVRELLDIVLDIYNEEI